MSFLAQKTRMVWSSRKMKESDWSRKCRAFTVNGNFQLGQPKKTWNVVIKSVSERKESPQGFSLR